MRQKRIIFTRHARERMQKRGLTPSWVIDIIKHHHISLPIRADNTQEFRREGRGSYYYVVVEHRQSAIVVITAGETHKP